MNRFMKKTAAAVMSLAMIASAGAAVSADVLKTVPVLSASAYGDFITVDHVIYEVYSDHVNVAGFEAGYRNLTIRDKVKYNGTYKYVTTMDSTAFAGRNVQSVTFNTTKLTTIPSGAFKDCADLVSVKIPQGVTEIKNGAFKNCTNLASVTLPASLKYIYDEAFYNCSSLPKIIFGYRVRYIGANAFQECTNLYQIVFRRSKCETLAANAFRANGVYAGSYGTHVYVPNNGGVKDYFDARANYLVDRYVLGDVNGDNKVTIADAELLEQLLSNQDSMTPKQKVSADVNDSYIISQYDATMIRCYLNEQIQLGMNVYMCCIMNGVNYG